jgi:hypothetical protein
MISANVEFANEEQTGYRTGSCSTDVPSASVKIPLPIIN